ncbi:exo-beta-N-acetylmuramidase NamZ family protein [Bifidobacterium sp.]|jgi:uncharacterized protein YbbC (DUF1343 family)|uniref:exo-beta-N-acetylmuramidase NamZ family protein n=1 Tax=Bifidobacterium sp. TaxID=41200 RepID=UPI0025B7FF60|nr:DUF1343 domain-containing protein [Bifidobacterium sp.]MCH4209333.1 DUF1343 domain-containing protein [Bifidobacterium sp.]
MAATQAFAVPAPPAASPEQRTGLDRVLASESLRTALFASRRIGFVTNFTAVTNDYRRAVDALLASGVNIVALFSPEHGLDGMAQAGHSAGPPVDPRVNLPVYDTYQLPDSQLDGMVTQADLDLLICDLQDVGTRFWTYPATMIACMRAAARAKLPFMVLDRPNPLGTEVAEGPVLDPRFTSFIGALPIPLRHGLTLGQLARLTAAYDRKHGLPTLDPQVITGACDHHGFIGQGSLWLPPSPNMATFATACVYPGTGLLEGTNVSEGRGTTHPFEMFGAPWIDGRLVELLRSMQLPGVFVREVSFIPTFGKYAGEPCRGGYLHVSDPTAFRPVRTGLSVIAALARLYPDDFKVLAPARASAPPALDLLWGSGALRLRLERHENVLALDERTILDPREIYPQVIFEHC